MKLHLTYCSSDEGLKLVRLFKYIKHKQTDGYDMSYEMSDLRVQMRGSGGLELSFSPANKSIYGYDNIRTALKCVFPTLVDPTPTKRVPIEFMRIKKLRHMSYNSRHPHIV